MGFFDKIFKPVGKLVNGVVIDPIDNISTGIGNAFSGIGTGVSAIGTGVGSGVTAFGSGLGTGVSAFGSGVGSLASSPMLLIALGIGGIFLFKMIS